MMLSHQVLMLLLLLLIMQLQLPRDAAIGGRVADDDDDDDDGDGDDRGDSLPKDGTPYDKEINFVKRSQVTSADNKLKHIVIVDAGSTGSKGFIFLMRTIQGSLTGYELVNVTKLPRVSPGLASYQFNPTRSKDHVNKILEMITKSLPEEQHRNTLIVIGGTAGFRLISFESKLKIRKNVNDVLAKSQLKIPKSNGGALRFLTGADEAKMTWLTINYLLRDQSQINTDSSFPILETGGASTQIAHRVADDNVSRRTSTIQLGDAATINIRAKSYLGLGSIESAKRMANESFEKNGITVYKSFCVANKANLSVTSGSNDGWVIGYEDYDNSKRAAQCWSMGSELAKTLNISAESEVSNRIIIGVAALYYIAQASHIRQYLPLNASITIKCYGDKGHMSGSCSAYNFTLEEFYSAQRRMCNDAKLNEEDEYIPFYCVTMSGIAGSLHSAMQVTNTTILRLVQSNDQNPIGWALGYALYWQNHEDAIVNSANKSISCSNFGPLLAIVMIVMLIDVDCF